MTIRLGDRVVVTYGRWAGRTGRLAFWHRNPGGPIQQSQTYAVVDLEQYGRAKARRVRVLKVEAKP